MVVVGGVRKSSSCASSAANERNYIYYLGFGPSNYPCYILQDFTLSLQVTFFSGKLDFKLIESASTVPAG